jgi:hypothetical protein
MYSYLSKPIRSDELFREIYTFTEPPRPAGSPTAPAGLCESRGEKRRDARDFGWANALPF